MNIKYKKEIFEQFCQYATESRVAKIQEVSLNRTRHIAVALEDLNQPHNISASLRSCEGFGIQDVHIIQKKHKYRLHDSISRGSDRWLDIYKYREDSNTDATKLCIDNLKKNGYKIVATSPNATKTVHDLEINKKLCLVFGTERLGLSEYAMENADELIKIPMYGFTESFNISVSLAICLYEINSRLRDSDINFKLSEEEIVDLQLKWLGGSTNRYNEINELLSNRNKL